MVVVVAVAAVVVASAAVFVPWARTGARQRDAVALFRTVTNLGLDETVALRLLLRAHVLVPLLAAATWLCAVLGRRTAAAVLSIACGAVAVAAGAVVLAAPVPSQVGPLLSTGAGVVAVVAGAWLATKGRR